MREAILRGDVIVADRDFPTGFRLVSHQIPYFLNASQRCEVNDNAWYLESSQET